MNEDGIPELIETWRIARAMSWGNRKMADFLAKEGLTIQSCKGCARYVRRDELQVSFSFIYAKLVEAHLSGKLLTSRGGRREKAQPNDANDSKRANDAISNA